MTTEYTVNFALAKPDFRYGPWNDLVNGNMDAIDTILYAVLNDSGVSVWGNNVEYTQGTSALDGQQSTTWMCLITHLSAATGTFAAERAAHPTYWTQLLAGFAPRGQWTNNTNYFPYDLVYDGNLGIMALCKTAHTSNPSGNIKNDATFWSFLIDMSNAALSTAVAVTYSNASSTIPSTNVQGAIDYVQTEIVSLNNVNITQGNEITTNTTNIGTNTTNITGLTTRMGAVESKNTAQDTTIANHESRIATIENTLASGVFFAAGTVMLFYQAAAPTGWTKVVTQNDKVLRVVNGTTGGGGGGTNPFTTAMGANVTGMTTLAINTMPAHTHSITYGMSSLAYNFYNVGNQGYIGSTITSTSAGGGSAHNHTYQIDMQYIDVILASKN